MSLGEHAILRISAACGYGAEGSPPVIPANADLVFDVELNGINGRRAGTAAFGIASAPVAVAAKAPPPALPRCIKSSCGHAISWDSTGTSRPVCLCNPLCEQAGTMQGVLPCCPGLQEICLDPYRSPSPAPPVAAGLTMSAQPMSMTTQTLTSSLAMPVAPAMPAAPAALPTCRPNSCGKGMAAGVSSMTAVCACDASCLTPGNSLPCCQSFREVCQSAPAIAPISQQQFDAQQAARSSSAASTAKQASAACALGKTMWAEQETCDKKRWAIQNGKCKKVCPSVDTQSGIKYYPTGKPGKAACAAALELCK